MNASVRRGCLVGGLLAVAIIAPLVYDDYVLYHNGLELSRHLGHGADTWIPLLGADLQDLLRVGFGLLLLVAIVRAYARGRSAWSFAVAGAVVAAITIVDSTFDVLGYPGDVTVPRVGVLPVLVAGAIAAALVLAHRHRRDHQPRFT